MRNDLTILTIRRQSPALAGLILATILFAYTGDANAQGYPKRAIQLHVAHDADGNSANQIAAIMRQTLATSMGVEVVVAASKNRAGKTAAQIVTSGGGASGYQVMLANAQSHLLTPVFAAANKDLPASLLGVVASSPMLCVVNMQSKLESMTDLSAQLKREPKFRVSSAGKFSHTYVTAQLMLRAAGVTAPLNHLGLKSPAAALAAVLKGTAQFTCVSAALASPFIKRRQLKPLMATSPVAGIDVPTASQAGYSGFEVLDDFIAVAASRRVKSEIINVWQRALTQLSQNKAFVTEGTQLGFRVGRAQLMLQSQANAVIEKKQAALRNLMSNYGVAPPRR